MCVIRPGVPAAEIRLWENTTLEERMNAMWELTLQRAIDAVAFDDAWAGRLVWKFADQPVAVLSARHLIENKRAVGRTQDLADVEWLEGSRTS